MALTDYAYSIYDDFVINHKVDITILQEEIQASTIITTELHHIDTNLDEDICEVWFNDALTQDEETELDAIIAAHTGLLSGGVDPSSVPEAGEGGAGDLTLSFGSYNKNFFKFAGDSWTPSTHFIFRGTNQLGTPIGVQAVIYSKDDNDKYFDLRVFDSTNNQVVFDWIRMHSEKKVWKVFSQPVTTGWPAEQALLELQGRKSENDGCDFYVSFFMIQFSGTVPENLPSGVS